MVYPKTVSNWIGNAETKGESRVVLVKQNPATGETLCRVARGGALEAREAVRFALRAFPGWAATPPPERGELIRKAALLISQRKDELAEIVALEAGKSKKDALAEVGAAIECGFFFAGEGRRFAGEIIPSANPGRRVELRREPIGVGALITPFNNPAAGVAWKLFPALLSGNAVILKAHSETPYVPFWYAKLFKEVGLPKGLVAVLQGRGSEVGAALVQHPAISFVSFTGSVATGAGILKAAADRLTKVSIEAGGKNPFVVCDDADLERAAGLAVQGAFVDAGQRCAATSRIIVMQKVYQEFREFFLERVAKLKIGIKDTDDYGAIISEERLNEILKLVADAKKRGARVVAGGKRLTDPAHASGYFMEPTVLENVKTRDSAWRKEIFGPVVVLARAKNFDEAVQLANDSELKLTGAIQTSDLSRAERFTREYRAGVVRVNGPTHGSEPHMPFGGVGLSGNGWREPGRQALDFYTDLKQVSIDS